jgi:hypothetical protein
MTAWIGTGGCCHSPRAVRPCGRTEDLHNTQRSLWRERERMRKRRQSRAAGGSSCLEMRSNLSVSNSRQERFVFFLQLAVDVVFAALSAADDRPGLMGFGCLHVCGGDHEQQEVWCDWLGWKEERRTKNEPLNSATFRYAVGRQNMRPVAHFGHCNQRHHNNITAVSLHCTYRRIGCDDHHLDKNDDWKASKKAMVAKRLHY